MRWTVRTQMPRLQFGSSARVCGYSQIVSSGFPNNAWSMNKPRSLVVLSLALAAACGGSDTPTEPTVTVASVSVSPASATLDQVGATVQLLATVLGSDGSTMNTTVAWSSSATGVATVSSSGLVTGVAAGSATITASAGGRSGSAAVTVNAPPELCSGATTVSLTAGGSASFDASTCIVLPSGQSGDLYRVAVYRPTEVENAADVSTVTFQVTGLSVAASAPVAAPARVSVPRPSFQGVSLSAFQRSLRLAATTSRGHVLQRAGDARLWAELGVDALLPPRPAAFPRSIQRAASPAKIQLDPRTPSSCSAGEEQTVTALLIAENDDLAIYQDSTQNAATPVTTFHTGRILSYYSSYAKQMVDDYFGEPTDIDGNGKIVVFVTPSLPAGWAGQVWSGDFSSQETCAPSNEMEIIYLSNVAVQYMSDEDPSFQVLETVAHEAKHVVELYHRIAAGRVSGPVDFGPAWIQEGAAEIAGEMSSRIAWAAVGGPAVGDQLVRGDFGPPGVLNVTPENYGVLLRMARTIWYLDSQPNSVVTTPNGAGDGHDVYASGWHFHRWLGDAFGNAAQPLADTTLFRMLNDSLTATGVAGILSVTGAPSWAALLEDYAVAIMLNGTTAPSGPRAFTSYDFPSFHTTFEYTAVGVEPPGNYPWPVNVAGESPTAAFATASNNGPTGPSGIRIFDLTSNGTGLGVEVKVSTDMRTQPFRIVLVRVK
jgi:hypothetical protein